MAEGSDNAAVELIEPQELAWAILAVRAAGHELREATIESFEQNVRRLSIDESLDLPSSVFLTRRGKVKTAPESAPLVPAPDGQLPPELIIAERDSYYRA